MSETANHDNPTNISIRPVNLGDSRLVLSWRNDPDVRRLSRDINEIGVDTHEKWFNGWVSQQSQKGYFFVIEHLGTPIGMIRFDRKTNQLLEISILVESNFQGKGIAESAINVAIGKIKVELSEFTVLASIHQENLPSKKFFKKLGFEESKKSGDFLELFRNFFFKDL